MTHSRAAKLQASDAATYVYCLVHGNRAPSMRGVPAGVPGSARPRTIAVDRSLRAIVSNVPIAAFGEDAIERGLKDLTWVSACAVGHERVVERFLDRGTVVPMKLFTIFTSDARALDYLRRERRRIDRLVGRLRGRLEFGVRVSLLEPRRVAARSIGAASGIDYLQAKRALRDASRELSARASQRVEEIFEALTSISSEAVRRPVLETGAGGGRMLLDAACLVAAKDVKRFGRVVRTYARTLATEGYRITMTGPWPAYNFIGGAG